MDEASPGRRIRPNQPLSGAKPPPTAPIFDRDGMPRKARELDHGGLPHPRAHMGSDGYDSVSPSSPWRIIDADQGNGGLRNAAEAAARDGKLGDYTWVGTLGMPSDALEGTKQKDDIEDAMINDHNMLTVFCSDKNFDGHYNHFCKKIIWPVFHYQIPDSPKSKAYEDHSWKYYVNINQAFADLIVKNWKRGDTIWLHDYHLLLVPSMVRKRLPDAKIGIFLHAAFPSSEVFRCLAVRKELLEGILGANLVGFQIQEYARHFLQSCSRILSVEATAEGVEMEDRFVDVINISIGIDPFTLNKSRGEEDVLRWLNILQEKYKGKKLIVARDKLHPVCGIRQKLLAYDLFLNTCPEWRERTVLIQVGLPSSQYSDLDATVSDIATRVNTTWANLAYQPVVFLKQDIDYAQYLALLTIADALFITSQREGMNLTSHEYIYCQDGSIYPNRKHGSLILSEFTGTSSLFGKSQLSVNPWDHRQCANAIKQALEMGEDEKMRRWDELHDLVARHTGCHWFDELLSHLDRVYDEQHKRLQTSVPRLSMQEVNRKYETSNRRLFILDYEGTLVSWCPISQIIPVSPQRTLNVLNDLLLDERNVVYVTSGRKPKEMDRVFRRVPGLGLIAGNGCFIKDYGSEKWVEMSNFAEIENWKASVADILDYYLERTPGAQIEERHCSLLFHFDRAEDQEAAVRLAADCASHINDACEPQRVHAIVIDRTVIVEPLDWSKSTAAQNVFEKFTSQRRSDSEYKKPVDFLMVVGDGRDDEKVFKWANSLEQRQTVDSVVTVGLGNRGTDAAATLMQGVSGKLTGLLRSVNSFMAANSCFQ